MLKPIPLHHTESSNLLAGEHIDSELVRKNKDQAHWRAIVNLLASILGTGLLSMPGACKSSGLIFFLVGSTLAVGACHTTACYLVRTVKFLAPRNGGEDATYAGLASHVYGLKGERLVQYGLVLQQIGACVGYIVVIGDVFSPIMRLYWDLGSETLIRNLFVWLLMFPLTVGVKNLSSLSFASAAAVFAIVLFCIAVITNYFFVLADPTARRAELLKIDVSKAAELSGPNWFPMHYINLLRSIPLICFAYDMHFNAVPVHEDMKMDVLPPYSPVQVFTSASIISFFLSYMVTVLTGFAGYATFLNDTNPDILTNFAVNNTYIALIMNVVRAMYGIGLALAFPMIVWELRQVIFVLIWNTDTVDNSKFWLITTVIFVLTSLLVLTVADVTTVFGLVGSTVTPTLDYILPSLLYLRSGCAAKYNDTTRAKLILACGVCLIPIGLSIWVYERIKSS